MLPEELTVAFIPYVNHLLSEQKNGPIYTAQLVLYTKPRFACISGTLYCYSQDVPERDVAPR